MADTPDTPDGAGATVVNQNARLEVMRLFALLRDANANRPEFPEWFPLFEARDEDGSAWENGDDDIILGVQEATKIGHMENRALHQSNDTLDRTIANLHGGREWMVRLTPAGYDWIKAHDAIGEATQETGRGLRSALDAVIRAQHVPASWPRSTGEAPARE